MVINLSEFFTKKNGLWKVVFFVFAMMFFLTINTLVYAEDFTPALWLADPQNPKSWNWFREKNGRWWRTTWDHRNFLINSMKEHCQQRGKVLYGENSNYEIPQARIQEETSTYIVLYWYDDMIQEKLEKVQNPVNIYWPNYGDGPDEFIGTLNAVGDE
jgi:hypothetical protein